MMHTADVEEFPFALELWWTQVAVLILGGPFVLMLRFGLDIGADNGLLQWGFGIMLFLVILNLADEIIESVIVAMRQDSDYAQILDEDAEDGKGKSGKPTDGLLVQIPESNGGVQSTGKYVLENNGHHERQESNIKVHAHGWAKDGFFQNIQVRNDELIA